MDDIRIHLLRELFAGRHRNDLKFSHSADNRLGILSEYSPSLESITVRIPASHQMLLSRDENLAEPYTHDLKCGRQGIPGFESLPLSHNELRFMCGGLASLPQMPEGLTMMRSLFLIGVICSANQTTCGGIIFLFQDNTTPIGSGLDNQPFGSFTVGSLEITATASTGSFNATSSGFGINQAAAGDDTDGFDFKEDGGPGHAEGLVIGFDSDVRLNNIDVSSFGRSDEIKLAFSGGNIATVSATGTTSLGSRFLARSDSITIATTAGNYGNGWSLDFVEVTAVPESSSVLFLGTLVLGLLLRMRRGRQGV